MIDLRREVLRVLANSSTTLRKITGALSEPTHPEDVAVVLAQLVASGLVEPFEDKLPSGKGKIPTGAHQPVELSCFRKRRFAAPCGTRDFEFS